jgi:hypothetical protein
MIPVFESGFRFYSLQFVKIVVADDFNQLALVGSLNLEDFKKKYLLNLKT